MDTYVKSAVATQWGVGFFPQSIHYCIHFNHRSPDDQTRGPAVCTHTCALCSSNDMWPVKSTNAACT